MKIARPLSSLAPSIDVDLLFAFLPSFGVLGRVARETLAGDRRPIKYSAATFHAAPSIHRLANLWISNVVDLLLGVFRSIGFGTGF